MARDTGTANSINPRVRQVLPLHGLASQGYVSVLPEDAR